MTERRLTSDEHEIKPKVEKAILKAIVPVSSGFFLELKDIENELRGTPKGVHYSSALRRVTDGKAIRSRAESVVRLYNEIFSGSKKTKQKEKVDGKIVRASKRVLMIVSVIASLAAASFEVNHTRTRFSITETRGRDGSVLYTHEDKETTDILNYITGKAPLSESDRLAVYRGYVLEIYKVEGIKPPSNLDALNLEELRVVVFEMYKKVGKESDEEAKDDTEFFFTDGLPEYDYNPELYQRLWKLQKEVGAPKIRWAPLGGEDPRVIGAERANYDCITNTAWIDSLTALSDVVAEDAHAYQVAHHRWKMNFQGIQDGARMVFRLITQQKGWQAAHEINYETPGSVEYEAHTVIEPRLADSLGGEWPKRKPYVGEDASGK